MPVDNRIDPFRPQEPAIPGVPAASEKKEKPAPSAPAPQFFAPPRTTATTRQPAARDTRAKLFGAGIGIAAIMLAALVFLYWGHGTPARAPAVSSPAATPATPERAEKTAPAEKLLVGPGPVATTAELSRPWSAREFLFRGTLSPEAVPAMVVRLPGGDMWGFSLREPFGECELQYVTDLKVLEIDYGFHAQHPMVVNPCTRAVYDLMRYGGGAPNGGLVRGEIVAGSGVRPPMAIEMSTRGREIIAVRGE